MAYQPDGYGPPNQKVRYTDLVAANTAARKQLSDANDWFYQGANLPSYAPSLQGWTPTGGKSPWQTPAPSSYQPASSVGGGGAEANPFSVVSNTKNTQIKSLLDKVLAQSGASMSADLNKNPYSLYSNTKDAAQGQAIAGARDRFGNATAQTQQQLQDFTKEWLAGNAPVRQFADQDIAAVGNLYGAESDPNSLRGQFSQNAREDALAMQRLVGRGLDQLGGQLKSNRFMSGDDSRTTARAFNSGAQLLNQEAVRQSQLRRDNLLKTTDYQMANVGRRQQIDDAARMRGLVPLNASYAQSAAELGQLGQLGNLTGQNTVYNQDTPESRLSRQLGVIGQAAGIDQSNNFYSLRRPYEPDFSGYAPTGARRGTGGGYPVGPGGDGSYYEPDFGGQLQPVNPTRSQPVQYMANSGAGARYSGQQVNQFMAPSGRGYGEGYGYTQGEPGAGYDLFGGPIPYGDPTSQFYYPGYDAAQVASDQLLYE